MRTRTLFLTSVLGCMIALAVPAASLADLPGSDSSDPESSNQMLGTKSGRLSLGLDHFEDYSSCRYKDRCNDLQGIALMDFDVRDVIDRAPPGADIRFNLYDTGDYAGSRLAKWKVCQYNQYDQLLGCRDSGSFGVYGSIYGSTTSMRVILIQGVDRPFDLILWY